MCGIIGYIGPRQAAGIITNGLITLKSRGYDSAGLAIAHGSTLERARVEGKPEGLQALLSASPIEGTVGIGHNRWATHGHPSQENAHPHFSNGVRVAVVHNGTIENYESLRTKLSAKGFVFDSETDTEVLPNLIEWELLHGGAHSLADATARALAQVEGTYGIAVMSSMFPDEIVAARQHSPLLLGLGDGELFIASEEYAICSDANRMIVLKDGEIVTLKRNGSFDFHGSRESAEMIRNRIAPITATPSTAELQGYQFMMLLEIHEQPKAVINALRGRLHHGKEVRLGGLTGPVEQQLAAARRIVIVACGTSYYAGLVGKLYIERFAEVPVEVVYASEFKYDKALVREGDVVIGISQSGETADTIGAVALGKERGALCLGVTNRTNTSLPRLTHAGVFLQAGPEHAVASTKAYTAQVVILGLIAARIAHARGKDSTELQAFVQSLANVPALLEQALACEEQVKRIVEEYRNIHRALFIGRRYGVPLAYEGALKLREIAYIDALGTPAGELKHGTLALVEDGVPVFAICRADELQSKMLSSMQEVSARGGHVIAITTKGDTRPTSVARHVIELPDAPEELTPIICAPVMQLLAYYFGVILGHDVDHPRNLAKSVTVE